MEYLTSVFRIRIRSDPYHLAGSGSASGNVDLDSGTKKNRDKLAYESTKIIKILFFFKEITNFVKYTRIISSKLQQKNIVMSFKPCTEKIKKKKIGICSRTGPGSIIPEADPDPDPHQNDTDPKHCLTW